MEQLTDFFPGLTDTQQAQYAAMEALYREWNARINVISRKDMDHLMVHHILHAMAIAKVIDFPAGSTVLDVGTGGGFPGMPLAVSSVTRSTTTPRASWWRSCFSSSPRTPTRISASISTARAAS